MLIVDNSVSFTGALKCALSEAQLLGSEHRFVFVLPTNSQAAKLVEQAGHKVYLLGMKEISKSVSKIAAYPPALVQNVFALARIVKQEQIDCVQMNDFYNLLGAGIKMMGSRVKLVTYVRFLPRVMPAPLRALWTKAARAYADQIIAVSDTVLLQLPQNSKTIRIYDPVNLEERLPERKPGNGPEVKCVYLGNYIQGKGQDAGLAAFGQAYARNNRLRLKFAGGDMGLEKNKRYKEGLIAKTQELGLSEIVQFGAFEPDVEGLIKSADVLLNFSEGESFSMTCLEAAFYGTPQIATRCGGPEEIVQHEQTGLLVNVGDHNAMTEAILMMAEERARAEEMAQAGKEFVRKKFSIDHYKKQMNKMLEGLTS
jgi:glycosyltransferase involved in cell wall biosynthesis